MDEISENIFNEGLNKLFLRKIQFRENHIWMNTTWRSRNRSEEIQNVHWLNRSMSLNRKDDNNWKPINGQIKLSERIHLCRRLEMKDHSLSRELCKKLPRNWRIQKMLLAGRKLQKKKNNEDRKTFSRSMIRNHKQWVYSSTILIYWAVMTYLRSSSSSYYFEFKKA